MRTLLAVMLLFGGVVCYAGIVSRPVEYSAGGVKLKGYVSYDDHFKGKRPAVLVVHEWWGLNDYARMRADMLAKLGYVGFAVDMYGDGKYAETPDSAGKLSGEVMKNKPVLLSRFNAALEEVKKEDMVDPTRIGAIGYCFGGTVVLAAARSGANLKGVASFHGILQTDQPAEKGKVKAKILVCNGGADKFVSEESIKDFKAEMKSAGVEMKFLSYPGALHAFSNPDATALGKKFNMPIAYNEKGDKGSWKEMKMFFAKVFKK